MNTGGKIKQYLVDKLAQHAEGALELDSFTALLGVTGDVRALQALLQRVDDQQEGRGIPGIQNLRWVLFQPTVDNDDSPEEAGHAPYAMLLSFVFDGPIEFALEDLLALDATGKILSFCPGFDAKAGMKYLKERCVKCGYMFRDLGPLTEPSKGASPQYSWDATLSEIESAFETQKRFETFYAAVQPPGDPMQIRGRFMDEFGAHAFPHPLTAVERRLPDEERIIRRVSEVIRRTQARLARSTGKARRGAHAKTNGFISGTIRIQADIPERLAKGIFAVPGWTFPVIARSSNAGPNVKPDRTPDARGFAMSVFLPMDGSPRFERGGFLRPRDGDLQRQDFLLFSHSRFFAADAREAATLFSIISTGSGVQQVSRILAFAVGGGRWRQVGIMVAALSRLTLNPLRPTFHSATPYMLGEGHVVKYSLELVNPSKPLPWRGGAIIKALAEAKRRVTRAVTTDDHLRTELRETLREPMQLRLYVHAVEIARWASSPGTLIDAVEDATTDWNDLGAEKVHVATVTFEPQDPTREDAMQGGEVWAFNPWNALKAHRPVGSINRGRLSIMRDSAKLRAQANGQRAPGPAANAGEPLSYTEQKAAE